MKWQKLHSFLIFLHNIKNTATKWISHKYDQITASHNSRDVQHLPYPLHKASPPGLPFLNPCTGPSTIITRHTAAHNTRPVVAGASKKANQHNGGFVALPAQDTVFMQCLSVVPSLVQLCYYNS